MPCGAAVALIPCTRGSGNPGSVRSSELLMGDRQQRDRFLPRCACVGFALAVGGFASLAGAAKPSSARRQAVSWQILETANFRILSYSTRPATAETGQACERLRRELWENWTGQVHLADWSPKCDVVLHPNDASYLKEVGQGGATTVASSLVDQRQGCVRTRRVDVRSIESDWEVAALPHELMHVILAGHFDGRHDSPLDRRRRGNSGGSGR